MLHNLDLGRLNAQTYSAKAFGYTRTPMLRLADDGCIREVNAACRELFGLDLAGCQRRHWSYFEQRLGDRLGGGLFPASGVARRYLCAPGGRGGGGLILATDDLRPAVAKCSYHSELLGTIPLRVSELPWIDASSGACEGSMVSWEVIGTEAAAAFGEFLDRRLAHEIIWEVYAASYDRVLPQLDFYQEVVERHVQALRPDRIHTVLDLGAGTGTVAIQLLQLGKRVTAVDTCGPMLQKLLGKVHEDHSPLLTAIEDTAERLPQLPSASFDAVTVLLAMFDMPNPGAALSEADRLLKPGGVLIITEPRDVFDVAQLMDAAAKDLTDKGLIGRLGEDWKRIQSVAPLIRNAVLGSQERTRLHAEAVHKALMRQGYVDLTFRESHLGNCATIFGAKSG